MTRHLARIAGLVCLGSCTGVIDGSQSDPTNPGGTSVTGKSTDPFKPQTPPGSSFAPGPGGLRRLTSTQLAASLQDLLGPVSLGKVEEDLYAGGLAQVGASYNKLSLHGVETLEAETREALRQVFADTPKRDALVACVPKSALDRDDQCARSFLSRFGRRAWRGQLSSGDLARYVGAAGQLAHEQNDFYAGALAAAAALLQSPRFLYRVELGEPLPGKPGWLRYTSLEMATRLSYFLWNTTPDDALVGAGESSELLDATKLRVHAQRLLDSPRAREGLANVVDEVFGLPALELMGKDPQLFKQLTPTLRQAMATELHMLFQDVVHGRDGDVLDLFDTARSFANKELAGLYRLGGVTGDKFVPVTYTASTGRGGIMGTAAMLSLLSKPATTSPTARGKFIREVLMCQTMPPPPVPPPPPLPPPMAGLSLRQQLDQHKMAACASCHRLMDPLGYGLESFDALGIYRTRDHGFSIDPSGDLDTAPFQNARELGQRLRENPATRRCLVRTLYRYATGRTEADTEKGLLDDLDAKFQTGGNRARQLMLDIVLSDGFRFAQGEKGAL